MVATRRITRTPHATTDVYMYRYGVDSIRDLMDEHIVNSTSLTGEIGIPVGDSTKLLDAVAERRTLDREAEMPDFDSPVVNNDELMGLCSPGELDERGAGIGPGVDDTGAVHSGTRYGGEHMSKGSSNSSGAGQLRQRKVPSSETVGLEAGSLATASKVEQNRTYCLVDVNDSAELKAVYAKAAMQFPLWSYAMILGMTIFTVRLCNRLLMFQGSWFPLHVIIL